MSNEEYDKFIKLLKSIFDPSVVKEEKVNELRDWRINEEDRIQYPRTWIAEEYEVLLKILSREEAINKLGRSGMAVLVRGGIWRPKFFSWCKEKGKSPFSEDLLPLIKQFMKEKADEIKTRREKKKKKSQKQEEVMKLRKKLAYWDSDEKRRELGFFKEMGKIEDIEEFKEKNKKEIKDKIKELKKN